MMAYAFILTHEGYPCVFWLAYFNYGLGRVGMANGIAALVNVMKNTPAGQPGFCMPIMTCTSCRDPGSASNLVWFFVLNNRTHPKSIPSPLVDQLWAIDSGHSS
jgi:alpha-amylase